jgi:GNAT superfamily N-acetyltransferase
MKQARSAVSTRFLSSPFGRPTCPRTRSIGYPGTRPATLLGRLGIDRRLQGQGFGQLLLVDALRRSHAASQEVASSAVVTEAKDEKSAAFYVAHGFCRFPSRERTLYLPMATIARLFAYKA